MEVAKLSKSALEILDSPNFLSDEIIGFYFTYLTSITDSDDVLFIDPPVSDLLANVDDVDVVKASVEPLEFGTKNLIFFAVNDSEHWSLLVYDRKLNAFLHHDSRGSSNHMQARKLFETLKDCVVPSANGKEYIKPKKKNRSKKASVTSCKSAAPPSFEECTTPQQTNGYDCGLFVLAIARAICEWHCSKKKSNANYWFKEKQVNPSIIEGSMRSDLLKLATANGIKDLN
ncbi:protease [Lithospermum erythrorhizon]|uniref:Protease n=1 Tax=Lithospermum erythrorhizon TaxID=34254 RepID=A0AAV3P613_LITER